MQNILGALLALLTLSVSIGAQATPVSGQGTWETTLQARDLDGNGTTDAFYDTTLKITWLRDANLNGLMTWGQAKGWAAGYSLGAYSSWRLPNVVDSGAPGEQCSFGGTDCGYNVQIKVDGAYSELAHLFYITLGNRSAYDETGAFAGGSSGVGWGPVNTADFQLTYPSDPTMLRFWSQTPSLIQDRRWMFNFYDGTQFDAGTLLSGFGLAVHDGDVLAAPEPESLLLALTALSAISLARRRNAFDNANRQSLS